MSDDDVVSVYLSPPGEHVDAWVLAIGAPDRPAFACSSRDEARDVVRTMETLAAKTCRPLLFYVRGGDEEEWRRGVL